MINNVIYTIKEYIIIIYENINGIVNIKVNILKNINLIKILLIIK